MPCHCGYEFSVDPVWRGRGTTESYEVVERSKRRGLLMRAAVEGGLTVEARFALSGERLSVVHTIANEGKEPANVSAFTHPEWNYSAFGPQAELAMRRPDGGWHTMALNPENRDGRDLAFSGDKLPDGCWRATSALHPLVIEETFDAAAVDHARLNMSMYSMNMNLELHFKPCTLAPGERRTFSTTWRFLRPAK